MVKAQLIAALKAAGIDPHWAKWKDSQALGQAVREALSK
jgi:hypothetical protein